MTSALPQISSNLQLPWFLAQTNFQSSPGGDGIGIVGLIIYVAFFAAALAGLWKTFEKAGKPGWAAIVPIYNMVVLLEIAGKPVWWVILLFIPFVNFIMIFIIMIAFAKSFGKGAGFGIACVFIGFILIPVLGFGNAKYIGPQA